LLDSFTDVTRVCTPTILSWFSVTSKCCSRPLLKSEHKMMCLSTTIINICPEDASTPVAECHVLKGSSKHNMLQFVTVIHLALEVNSTCYNGWVSCTYWTVECHNRQPHGSLKIVNEYRMQKFNEKCSLIFEYCS